MILHMLAPSGSTCTLNLAQMFQMRAEILVESPKLWQVLLYAAIAVSILITSVAEQVATRDMKTELQSLRKRQIEPPSSDEPN